VSSLTPECWAAEIRRSLAKTVEAIVETGQLLKEAKADLGHGGFLQMLRDNVKVSADTAQQYMRIAEDLVIANAANWRHLPASRSALDALTRVDAGLKLAAIADGRIYPDMTAADVRRLGADAAEELGPGQWDIVRVRRDLRAALDRAFQGCPIKRVPEVVADVIALCKEVMEVYGRELGAEGYEALFEMREDLACAEPGQRHLIFDEVGKVCGALGKASSYPSWMGRRTRAAAAQQISAIDDLLDGRAAGLLGADLLRRAVVKAGR
jgi:hypothetical protein